VEKSRNDKVVHEGPPVVTIAITGTGGMIGSAILTALRRTGRSVRILSHAPSNAYPDADVRALPPPHGELAAFHTALDGATHIIHCAALNSDAAVSEDEMFAVNGLLVAKLAQAAATRLPGRFIHFSSIRAVAGADWTGTIGQHTEPRPTDAYGRSKLAGEQAVHDAFPGSDDRKVILRPAPVYGPGMRGAMRSLLGLAQSPWPLPFGSLPGTQPALSVQALTRAVLFLIDGAQSKESTFVVSDPRPLSLAEIVGAYREGLGRSAGLLSVPAAVLGPACALSGKRSAWDRLCAKQACDPSALIQVGWQPEADSRLSLATLAADLARQESGRPL